MDSFVTAWLFVKSVDIMHQCWLDKLKPRCITRMLTPYDIVCIAYHAVRSGPKVGGRTDLRVCVCGHSGVGSPSPVVLPPPISPPPRPFLIKSPTTAFPAPRTPGPPSPLSSHKVVYLSMNNQHYHDWERLYEAPGFLVVWKEHSWKLERVAPVIRIVRSSERIRRRKPVWDERNDRNNYHQHFHMESQQRIPSTIMDIHNKFWDNHYG